MNDLPEPVKLVAESDDGPHHHHLHRRKRRTRKKLYRKLIIGMVFILVCMTALLAWHFLVQEPPRRASTVLHLPG